MEFLVAHDPAGPFVSKSASDRSVSKAAVDRHRTVLDHWAADKLADYFRHEHAYVAHAV